MYTNIYFECECESLNHTFRITIDDEWPFLYGNFNLNNNLPLYKRILLALKYLFKFDTSPYGSFEEVILNKEKAIELRNILDEFINKKEST